MKEWPNASGTPSAERNVWRCSTGLPAGYRQQCGNARIGTDGFRLQDDTAGLAAFPCDILSEAGARTDRIGQARGFDKVPRPAWCVPAALR